MVVAASENNVIGLDNKLIWHLPKDLKHFKDITMGSTIVMGRKTFESLPGILPNRRHIILSKSGYTSDKAETMTLEEVLAIDEDIFVIGGEQIYNLFMEHCDYIELTRVHTEVEGDAFFPEINEKKWKKESSDFYKEDAKNKYSMTFEKYSKLSDTEGLIRYISKLSITMKIDENIPGRMYFIYRDSILFVLDTKEEHLLVSLSHFDGFQLSDFRSIFSTRFNSDIEVYPYIETESEMDIDSADFDNELTDYLKEFTTITILGHSSVMLSFDRKAIWIRYINSMSGKEMRTEDTLKKLLEKHFYGNN